jgi:hypothetical protein
MSSQLHADLQAGLLRALQRSWHDVNLAYFKGALLPVTLELLDADTLLGQWDARARTIRINRAMAVDRPWGHVVEVLKHEIAHQAVDELLQAGETAHGPAFRAVCDRLGITARASGELAGTTSGGEDSPEARVMQRVAKLLSLATSPNEHEAQAAMSAAQRLMLKYNLSIIPSAAARGHGFRHLGAPTGRVTEHERLLATILGEHFFVETIWVPVWRAREGKRGSVLEICGSPANLEMAEYVHSFLMGTGERLWNAYRRERGVGNRDRRTYLAGVMTGFRDKLTAAARVSAQEGLVWVGDADLGRFFRKRHPLIRWTRYSASGESEAHADGKAAGRNIVLQRVVHGEGGSGPRLLGSRGT